MRVFLSNLGCKLNQAELEALARRLTAAGYEVVGSLEAAELHVVNTCTVTHRAARDSRKLARRGGRAGGGVRTVLTGCWASDEPEAAAQLAGVDLVVPNHRKEQLPLVLQEHFPPRRGAPEVPVPKAGLPRLAPAFGNTRALVKVEDGCNVGCAFCIIPSTRGRQHSRPLPDVVAEVAALARDGAQEVVVTGVQISHYRWQGQGLCDLVEALLAATPVPRLRLTSIAPWRFDDRLLELLASPRLCRHVHLSLQSGASSVLRRMQRPYDAPAYAAVVERLRRAVPGIAVTTDVIAGFPGESAAEHRESLAFARAMGFARIHAFPYSPRPGTAAAEMPGRVPPEVQKERMAELLALGADLEGAFLASQVGQRLEVLWEERRHGRWSGTSDNYVRVYTAAESDLANRLTRVDVTAAGRDGVEGCLVERPQLPGAQRPPRQEPVARRSLLPVVG